MLFKLLVSIISVRLLLEIDKFEIPADFYLDVKGLVQNNNLNF